MYFFDSYALVEIAEGNLNYKRFVGQTVYLSVFNAVEFLYHLLGKYDKKITIGIYNAFRPIVLEATENDLLEAARFRKKNRRKKLSYSDCVGYTLAKRDGLKFLTGDRQFEGMENVEFVK